MAETLYFLQSHRLVVVAVVDIMLFQEIQEARVVVAEHMVAETIPAAVVVVLAAQEQQRPVQLAVPVARPHLDKEMLEAEAGRAALLDLAEPDYLAQ
jgi:hypothetical protein